MGAGATARNHWGSGIKGRVPAWGTPVLGSPGRGIRGRRISSANLGREGTQAPESRQGRAQAAAATGHPPGATSPGLAGAAEGSEGRIRSRVASRQRAGQKPTPPQQLRGPAPPRPAPTCAPPSLPETTPPPESHYLPQPKAAVPLNQVPKPEATFLSSASRPEA